MKTKIIYSLILVLFTTSCTKDLLEVKNENSYDGDTFFTTPDAFNEALTATYSTLIHPGMYAREYYFIFDLLGNDASPHGNIPPELSNFNSYTFNTLNKPLREFFNTSYKTVLRSNFLLDKVNAWVPVEGDKKKIKKQYIAEATYLKAFAYFNLVTNFGDVPLRKTFSDHENYYMARTDKSQIWDAIESDLKSATVDLPENYSSGKDYGRITRGAAIALLGKSYLYQKKYDQAIIELNKLMGKYSLAASLDDIFVKGDHTDETIFAVMHSFGKGNSQEYMFGGQEMWAAGATHTGREFEYGFKHWNNVLVSDSLVYAFTYAIESNPDYVDPRSAMTFYGKTKGGDDEYNGNEYTVDKFNWRKYTRYDFMDIEDNSSTINSQVIRYADVLLMLAECHIYNDDKVTALDLINRVRSRSGVTKYTKTEFELKPMELLMRERRLEFAGEQSRYSDLVRWG
ncbi:MAG: RagB/SusD family nutrient uptake outer membrane protein, partial [Chlamydiia bacterium]|nr:RagB/SusD family nutrient uptake outer membrane protein [Chlamydiia bacterium]